MSWHPGHQRWMTWGVWVATRARWARDVVRGGVLVLHTRAAATTAVADFRRDFPGERFHVSTIPTQPLNREALWSPKQVESYKARFQKPEPAMEAAA